MASTEPVLNSEQEDELAAMRDLLRHRFPIETILEVLGSGEKPEDVVLGAAAMLAGDLAPALLAAVERAATGAELDERGYWLAFYGLHILGGVRDARAFPALMRILRLPYERLDRLLGDALTGTINRVAIGVFDGRADELFALIADNEADEFARFEMLGVTAFLAFEGRIAIEEVKRFLVRFDEERLAPEQDLAWCGWERAIALLGFRDLAPRVEAAWGDGRTPEGFSEPKYFRADMKRAETAWSDANRFKDTYRLGYIEDIADELSWVTSSGDEEDDAYAASPQSPNAEWKRSEPYINPLRHVGRNDPCPCGSGKKAKRCCLAG